MIRNVLFALSFISLFDVSFGRYKCKVKLHPVLHISTNAAAGWKHFQIDGQDYLVVANFWDGVPEHGMRANSILYKVEVKRKRKKPKLKLTPVQQFATVGAHGWEYIESNGGGYLIVPNYYKCGSTRGPAEPSCNSTAIYSSDRGLRRFVEHQSLNSAGPASVLGFAIDQQIYFALGENFDDKVAIYKLQGSEFVLHQKIDVFGAGVSAFVSFSAQEGYLVSASYHDPVSGWLTRSKLFRWNHSTRSFVQTSDIPTAGAHHVEAFSVNTSNSETKYVFIANDRNDKSSKIHSAVYRFAPDGNQVALKLHQRIPTDGAHGAAVLTTQQGNVVLAVANFGDRLGKRYHAHSSIHVWNASGAFELAQEIPTFGATDWESFRIGDAEFFAVSNEGAEGAPTDSVIYFVQETCPQAHTEL